MRWVLALGVLAGCYAPQPSPGAPCPDGICPTGLVCSPATMTCERTAVDAGEHADTPIMVDARIDAAMIDARLDAPPPNVPMLIQQQTNYIELSDTVSATFAAAPASGHVLLMVGASVNGSLTSVTGSGATWTLATASFTNSNIEIWYGVSNGTGSTITITRTASNAPIWLNVSEWSGLATTNTLYDAVSNDGFTSPASAGSVTTPGPALLVFGVTDDAGNTFGTPSPSTWTTMMSLAGTSYMQTPWYRVAPAAGTFTASVSETQHSWEAGLAAFRYTP